MTGGQGAAEEYAKLVRLFKLLSTGDQELLFTEYVRKDALAISIIASFMHYAYNGLGYLSVSYLGWHKVRSIQHTFMACTYQA